MTAPQPLFGHTATGAGRPHLVRPADLSLTLCGAVIELIPLQPDTAVEVCPNCNRSAAKGTPFAVREVDRDDVVCPGCETSVSPNADGTIPEHQARFLVGGVVRVATSTCVGSGMAVAS